MAFFCPVRIGRKKKKHGHLKSDLLSVTNNNVNGANLGPQFMGRITGSDSIETLVRVGIEKENGFGPNSKMIVLHDFHPCVDDELEVKRGQIINVLYQENDWVYVIADGNNSMNPNDQQSNGQTQQEGFIPASYCAPLYDQNSDPMINFKKKLPRSNINQNSYYNNNSNGQNLNENQQFNLINSLSNNANNNGNDHNYSNSNRFLNGEHLMLNGHQNANIDLTLSIGTTNVAGASSSSNTNVASSNGVAIPPATITTAAQSSSPSIVSDHLTNHQNKTQNPLLTEHHSLMFKNNNKFHHQLLEHHKLSNSIVGHNLYAMGEVQPFFKDQMCGRYVMLYGFIGQDENDLSVERGEIVTVVNKDDIDWYWAIRSDMQEGFVPVSFTYPADLVSSFFQ